MFARCMRHCCLCRKQCGTNIEAAHIIDECAGGANDEENGIPLCLDCHQEIGAYRNSHPRGNKFRPEELRLRRDKVYELAQTGQMAASTAAPSPTHTEYQKRVIDRLAKLSDELYGEFNPASEQYLTGHHGLQEALALIHTDFERHKKAILAAGEWEGWVILPRDTLRIETILEPVRSDPFIPDNIRKAVVDLMERRLEAFSEISHEQLIAYRNALARGEIEPAEQNWLPIINQINKEMARRDCGPGHVEAAVHEIRRLIKEYCELPDHQMNSTMGDT